MILAHLAGIAAGFLFIWTLVLLWASWRLCGLAKELEAERQAVLRWQRLQGLYEKQHRHWN